MNLREFAEKWAWPNLKYYLNNCIVDLRKSTQKISRKF
jgi:hypothetical protein